MKRIFDRLVWFLMQAPYCPLTLNRKRFGNARCAGNTIRLLKKLGINPLTLVDVGANESQWAYWLRFTYPQMLIHSFDPLDTGKALGYYHKIGLHEKNESIPFRFDDTDSHFDGDSPCRVMGARFDSLKLELLGPRILKADAQNMTLPALRGFGNMLGLFCVAIVEVQDEESFAIYDLMCGAGFKHAVTVDSGYWRGQCNFHDVAFYK